MAVQTAERPDPVEDDRTFYADLWGTTSGPARSREGWRNLRVRSVLMAAAALIALFAYIEAGPLLSGAPSSDGGVTSSAEEPAATADSE